MHEKLSRFITREMNQSADDYANESFTLSSEETFQSPQYQRLFENETLSHQLYYSTTNNDPFFPFEVYQNDTLVALGYMQEDEQHILYLKHDDKILVQAL